MSIKKRKQNFSTIEDLEKEFGPRSVGRVLKAFREADDMSQAEFARRLGISRANLCDIEKGRKQVSAARAAKFANVIGMPEAVLVRYVFEEQIRAGKLKLKVQVHAA
jgi:transcriptional regulator with XRE-family HTH domain